MIDLYAHLAVPYVVSEAMDSPAMKRIAGVDMNCGMAYTSFPLFCSGEPYTRAEHCRNVSLLTYHFTQDITQALAGLFHDISTPVFSHVVDFVNGDYLTQESTEEKTAFMIQNDPVIQKLLENEHILFADVADYHRYPIADNDMPKLSCDRLEYTIGNAVNYRFISPQKARAFLDDLCIIQNAFREPELAFQSDLTAVEFAWTALRCGKVYSGREDRYSMERLARLLKDAIINRILDESDLYTTEAAVIRKLKQSSLSAEWTAFTNLSEVVETSDPNEGICVDAKRRYIDPLSVSGKRASELDSSLAEAIEEFIHEDYSAFLKGN